MKVTLNGQSHDIAECYERLSTRHYQNIISKWDVDEPEIANRDYFKLLCILTDTNFGAFERSSENEDTVYNAVGWVVNQPFSFSTDLPKVLVIGDKTIEVPKRIGTLSIGQNIILKRIIDNSRFVEENIAAAVSVYLQPLYDGRDFNYDRAMELKALVEEMPIYLTHPIGFFLLRRAATSGWKPKRKWLQILSNLSSNLSRTLPGWRTLKDSSSTTA